MHALNGLEVFEHDGTRYAEVIRATCVVRDTVFFSPASSSFQFGLLAHSAGFIEPPHYHHPFKREINDLQQMFIVQRGRVRVKLYADSGIQIGTIDLGAGDAIVLIHGVHGVEALEDFQCISVKQGPFLGTEVDKVFIKVKE